MTQIYMAFVDTPGLFADIIRFVIRQKYIHVVISLDPDLEEAYSVGRRYPSVPLIAGFEREEKEKILRAFPDAEYLICSIECTMDQKKYVTEKLREAMKDRFRYHYAILGLPFILLKRPFYQKNFYTCSSFAAKLLQEAGIVDMEKHFSLVTPKDFFEMGNKKVIFEGRLDEIADIGKEPERRPEMFSRFMKPAYSGAVYVFDILKRSVLQ